MEIRANGHQEWILKWLTLQLIWPDDRPRAALSFADPSKCLKKGELDLSDLGVQLHLAQYQGIIRAADSDYKMIIKNCSFILQPPNSVALRFTAE